MWPSARRCAADARAVLSGLAFASALGLGCAARPPAATPDPDAPSALEACFVPSNRAPEPVVVRAPLVGPGRRMVRPVPLDLDGLPRAKPDEPPRGTRAEAAVRISDEAALGTDGSVVASPLLLLGRSDRAPSSDPVRIGPAGRCPLLHPIDAVRATLVTSGAGAALVLAQGRVATPTCVFTERARRRVVAAAAGDSGAFAFRGCGKPCREPETLGLLLPLARRLVGDGATTATARPAGFSLALVPLDRAAVTLLVEVEHAAVLELAHLVLDGDTTWEPRLVERFVAPRLFSLEIVRGDVADAGAQATLFVADR